MIIVSLVILLFLWHIPSAIVPILTIPVSVLLAFIPMYFFGRHLNIMSLAGHRHLDRRAGGRRHRRGGERLQEAPALAGRGAARATSTRCGWRRCKEVGPVGLLLAARHRGGVPARLRPGGPGGPAVQAAGLLQEPGHGASPRSWPSRWTRPCGCCSPAWTPSPSGRAGWPGSPPGRSSGTYYSEEKHPISRGLFRVYEPACRFVLRHPEDDHRDRRSRSWP